jgi:tetratricopeptide (TPR) repeat protein
VQAANYFWHEGDRDGALAGYELALKSVPDYPPALVGQGRVALARGRAAEAAPLLARAYERNPLVETAWLLGDARTAAGDADGAARAYELVERTGTTDPRTLSLFLATKRRAPARALQLAEEEHRRRPDVYSADALAWALFHAGRVAEARAASDRALALGTRDARLLYHAGVIRAAQGERDGGRQLLAQARRLGPGLDRDATAEVAALHL